MRTGFIISLLSRKGIIGLVTVAAISLCSVFRPTLGVVLLFLLFTTLVIRKRTSYGVIALIIWIAIQNTLLPLLYSLIGGRSIYWLVALSLSELTPVILLILKWRSVFSLLRRRSALMIAITVLALLAAVMFILQHSHSVIHALYNLRMVVIPTIFLLVGYFYSNISLKKLLLSVSILTTAGALFGVVDALFLGSSFWRSLHMGYYWVHIKHLPAGFLVHGLPGNFYENYGGTVMRRVVSIYGDPLAAGYSMALGFAALLFSRESYRNKWIWLTSVIVILLAIALTYTRAAFIIVVIEFIFYYYYRKRSGRPISGLLFVPLVGIIFLAAAKVIVSTLTLKNGSMMIHLHAFMQIPSMLKIPLGLGAGASGGPEGAYLEIWWQFGLIVLASFIVFLIVVFRHISQDYLKFYLGAGMLSALIVTGLLSQELLTDTAAGMGWIVIGLTLNGDEERVKTRSGMS